MQHEIWIAANRTCEVRIELLCETKVANLLRRVEGPLHGAQHHHRKHALERRALDLLQELRKVPLTGEISAGDSKLREVAAQFLELVGVGGLVQAREDLHAARPELLRDRLVRRDHALLDHLVRFVIRSHLDAGHHTLLVDLDLGLRDLHVEGAIGKTVLPQLLGQLVDGEERPALHGLESTGLLALQLSHHLLVGEARLGADDALGEGPGDAVSLCIEGQEGGERVAVLVRNERTNAVRQLLRQHRHDLVHQINRR